MTSEKAGFTRRSLIAAAGIGALGAGGVAQASTSTVEYNRTTLVEDGPINLRVDWKEWYNGSALESQDTPTDRDDTAQPLINLTNVLPADSGKTAFGLTTEAGDEEDEPPPAQLQMRIRELPESGAENELTEPEAKTGDATPNRGELQDFLNILVWYDTGIAAGGTPIYGHCDGEFNPVINEKLDEGPFAVVSVPPDSETWVDLDAHPNQSEDCLNADEALCLGLTWTIPDDVGNIIQSDSVAFAIEFRALQCSNA